MDPPVVATLLGVDVDAGRRGEAVLGPLHGNGVSVSIVSEGVVWYEAYLKYFPSVLRK